MLKYVVTSKFFRFGSFSENNLVAVGFCPYFLSCALKISCVFMAIFCLSKTTNICRIFVRESWNRKMQLFPNLAVNSHSHCQLSPNSLCAWQERAARYILLVYADKNAKKYLRNFCIFYEAANRSCLGIPTQKCQRIRLKTSSRKVMSAQPCRVTLNNFKQCSALRCHTCLPLFGELENFLNYATWNI